MRKDFTNYSSSLKLFHFDKTLLIFFIFLGLISYSQTQYDVSTSGTSNSNRQPGSHYYGYHRSAYIFPYSDITTAGGSYGTITHLSWDVATSSSTAIPMKIYMKETSSTSVASATWSTTISGATTVYDGSQTFSSADWHQIDITDFDYASDNIMIMVEMSYGGSGNGNSPKFETSSSTYGRAWWQDGSAPTDDGFIVLTGSSPV